MYGGGENPCVLASLLSSAAGEVTRAVQRVFRAWIDQLAAALLEAGMRRAEARRRAISAVIQIQGALIVSRGIGDRRAFRDALSSVRALLVD
jgi:TetR/AcrR family transcriptional regulator, lmrAB and yxaGH operons repressor